ncbi:putative protein NUCLEAR FUSION DEFECTIVE 4 [Iris pallida]|uniref:Nodulin-like domain-containing protein n=1 Tax=Iris pallida TaxID=29817 RepID=A0AAX6HGD7_IRIPA|nr:putative protein NUCLEAR FUSION DEFECTIVE 4 [Iris pallida]
MGKKNIVKKGVPSHLYWQQWVDLLQHSCTGFVCSKLPQEPRINSWDLEGLCWIELCNLNQIYIVIHTPDHASLIFMVAVGPTMVFIALMFIVRPVGGLRQVRPSNTSFMFIYSVCLILAAYYASGGSSGLELHCDHLIHCRASLSPHSSSGDSFLANLFVMQPHQTKSTSCPCLKKKRPINQDLLMGLFLVRRRMRSPSKWTFFWKGPDEVDSLPTPERQKRIAELQVKLFQAAAVGAVRVKRRKGTHRGEGFTLTQALIKADFWLIFLSPLLGSGTGLTVIDNLGQMSQSLGYDETHVFVSMISIWNFLGRVAGGCFSEIIVSFVSGSGSNGNRSFLLCYGLAWSNARRDLLVGLGYGTHWAIVPAAASELFGLKNFGALYNFLTVANQQVH